MGESSSTEIILYNIMEEELKKKNFVAKKERILKMLYHFVSLETLDFDGTVSTTLLIV